jgi:hypothetical protein
MTKTELTESLKRHCGGSSFITRAELQQYMNYATPKPVDKFLSGLDRISGTRYFIGDVASNILKYRG